LSSISGVVATDILRSDGPHLGYANGLSQTVLSRAAAPPRKRSWWWAALIALLDGFLLFGLIGAQVGRGPLVVPVIVLLLCGWRILVATEYNQSDYPALLADWKESYMCMRCSQVFRWP